MNVDCKLTPARLTGLLLLAWSAGGGDRPAIRLGAAAPEIVETAAADAQGRLVLVALLPNFSSSAGCKSEMDASARIQQDLAEVSVVGVVSLDEDATEQFCGREPAIPLLSGAGSALSGSRTSLLVDRDRIVRRVIRGGSAAEHSQRVVREVKAWQFGHVIYEAQCARCHGSDGMDTGYPFIETLGGIGNRHNEDEIIRLTEATGAVDLSSLNAENRNALAIYVAGL
jgi:hypothetical protein